MPMIASLSELPLFAGLSASECSALEGRMTRRDFAPPGAAARQKADITAENPVDLLQSDIIRELQLAANVGDGTGETKQDLVNASEDAPIIRPDLQGDALARAEMIEED